MFPLILSACTAVSAMGRGLAPTLAALRDGRSGLRPCAFPGVALDTHVGEVEGLADVRLPEALARFDCRNNRLAAQALATDGFTQAVAAAVQRYGRHRVAVVLGTSTSGILSAEEAFRRRSPEDGALPATFDYAGTHDLASLGRFVAAMLDLAGPVSVISTACSSAAKAFLEAAELMAGDVCDAAVVGGADSLCGMTLHGFAALDLLARGPCRPLAADRDGISIGEAAAFALLERPAASTSGRIALLGGGASTDAHHMSAPHPEGAGAARAMRLALASAGLDPADIDYVNLHGTGTRANDAAEDLAVHDVLGDRTPCSSTKGWSGHTLGTAGALEAIFTALCIEHGLVPGSPWPIELDTGFRTAIVRRTCTAPLRCALSNSFGFGGSNCSLILGVGP
jgi:3-oxoacyl-[acyl-carrier-protein] synthase-1